MNKSEKIDYLKDLQAGKIIINPTENPLQDIDFNHLPCGTVEDFIQVLKCYNYTSDMQNKEWEKTILFEGLIKAGRKCELVDFETERIWRKLKASHPTGNKGLLPLKASKLNSI